MGHQQISHECRVVVIWIDWYPYHVARFRGLVEAFPLQAVGIELVGGVGVHAGLKFRVDLPVDLPIHTLMPGTAWRDANAFQLAFKLWRKLSELKPGVVLIPGYYTLPAMAAALWARTHAAKSVLMTESTAADHPRAGWKEALKSWLIRSFFSRAVVGGRSHVSYLHQLGFAPEKITRFYDVVDNDFYEHGTQKLRSTAALTPSTEGPSEASYFLYVGRLAEEKNVATLLSSWISYRDNGGTWSLMLVGDGPEASRLRELANASPYSANVHFPGLKSSQELLPLYAFAGCFVLPSSREPWGLVVNEALASALPVIVSSRCGCAADLVSPDNNGFLFEPEDAAALTELLHRMEFLDPQQRVAMRDASLRIIRPFSPQNFGRSILSIAETVSTSPAQVLVEGGTMIEQEIASSATPAAVSAGRWVEVVSHTDPKYGGLSAAVPALRHHLAKGSSIDVSLAAFCSPNEHVVPPECESKNIAFWPASRRSWFSSKLRADLSDSIGEVDGIHIHGLWESSTAVAASLARERGIPYVLSAHGMLEPWALRSSRAKKLLYSFLVERKNVREAACLHALTASEADQYIQYGAHSPIAVIPNGVDVPHHLDSSIFLRAYPELQGKRIVLFLARLHPKKGLDLLLEAWSSIASSWPDAHLVLAGPDSEGTQAALASFIADRRLTTSVSFTGMLRDEMKWGALAAAECFVLPSRSEGLSVSLLEAMGSGLPVIVTEACNMPEIEAFGAGWQIETSAEALSKAITELLQNTPEENQAIGSRGLQLIRTNYTWPAVARQMAEVYRWVQGGPAPTATRMIYPHSK